MNWFVAAVALCVLVPSAHCASGSVDWCYHQESCNDTLWAQIAPQYCNGSRQSPIDIISASATINDSLTEFTFTNFDSTTALKTIENTGRTVKVVFDSGVKISGGGLPDTYESLQFHLHWGNTSSDPGSEHLVDGKQYPMELHIVNMRSSHNGNVTQAFADSEGFAALGFLIDVMEGNATGQPESWNTLTSYLANITDGNQIANMTSALSLDHLLDGVDRSKYFRYHGSLTTPSCNEAVVWTVFKDSIKVSKDLIDRFSTTVYFVNSTASPFMTRVFRDVQPALPVSTQASGSQTVSYSLGLMTLSLLLGKS